MVKWPGWKRTRRFFLIRERTGNKVKIAGRLLNTYICCLCKKEIPEPEITVHHLNPFSVRPDLVHRLQNLILLCRKCHKKFSSDIALIKHIENEFDELCIESRIRIP